MTTQKGGAMKATTYITLGLLRKRCMGIAGGEPVDICGRSPDGLMKR